MQSVGWVEPWHGSSRARVKLLFLESWVSTCWVRSSVFLVFGIGRLGPKEVLLGWYLAQCPLWGLIGWPNYNKEPRLVMRIGLLVLSGPMSLFLNLTRLI